MTIGNSKGVCWVSQKHVLKLLLLRHFLGGGLVDAEGRSVWQLPDSCRFIQDVSRKRAEHGVDERWVRATCQHAAAGTLQQNMPCVRLTSRLLLPLSCDMTRTFRCPPRPPAEPLPAGGLPSSAMAELLLQQLHLLQAAVGCQCLHFAPASYRYFCSKVAAISSTTGRALS
jgi:hypothetical protein